ncbi:MAG: hypothetical protein DRG27_01400 [Deltaproteobacteria bacterium]|nr:MAG: hypothetical protein DRG27_01400 [Deltaproteobacteria bacterium]
MKKTSVKIVHISDVHLSKGLEDDPCQWKNTLNFGHDLQALIAFERILKDIDFDVLVVSGDVSRAGEESSFSETSKFLTEKTALANSGEIGLDLIKRDKPYITVPGNHDRYDGLVVVQGALDRYEKYFENQSVVHLDKNDSRINFHLFDSSFEGGGFAYGNVDSADMKSINSDEKGINVAVLHHHIIYPPEHKRNPFKSMLELKNVDEVVSYFVANGFDAVLFGHTHRHYFNCIPASGLVDNLPDKRKRGDVWKRMVPGFVLKGQLGDDCCFGFEYTKSGQPPSQEDFWIYLFAKHFLKKNELKSPSECLNSRQFHEQLKTYAPFFYQRISELRKNKILLSMAPSLSKAELFKKQYGFHVIEYLFEDGIVENVLCSYYKFIDGEFRLRGQPRDFSLKPNHR